MNFSSEFVANIRAADGKAGELWLAQLETLLAELSQAWNIRHIEPMSPLTYNFVATVQQRENQQRAILKMSPPTRPVTHEIRWLRHFPKTAPEILSIDETRNAVLMQLCDPGTTLKNQLKKQSDEQVTRELCKALRDLRAEKAQDTSYRHLAELIPDLKTLTGVADPALHSEAESLFKDLTRDRSGDFLLHGDLHHENILQHGDSWKVIDPHGYVGDPVAETGVMIYNPLGELPKDASLARLLETRIRIMAEELSYDPRQVQAWCFCKTMLSAAWNIPDFPAQAQNELQIAAVIRSLKF